MRLQDVSAFEALGDIAKRLGIEFTLFGGAATRVWAYAVARPDHPPDLFDVTPFTSDIDLAHSGPADRTAEINAAIREAVPFAAWCRWALLDAQAHERAEKNRLMSTEVPLRRLALSTAHDRSLPAALREDIERGVVRFSRNPQFMSSEFAQAGRDVELFGLLLALNTQADLREITGKGRIALHGDDVDSWLKSEDDSGNLQAIGASRPLLNRLWMKLASYHARAGHDADPAYSGLLDRLFENGVFGGLDVNAEAVFFGDAPLTVSRPTAAGGFRVPDLSPNVVTGTEAREALDAYYDKLRLGDIYGSPLPLIDPAFELIGFVPHVTVRGATDAADAGGVDPDDVFESWTGEEFLHLAWTGDSGATAILDPDGVTACMMPWSPTPEFGFSTGAAVGGVLDRGGTWVRADLRDVMRLGADAKDSDASLLILQSRADAN